MLEVNEEPAMPEEGNRAGAGRLILTGLAPGVRIAEPDGMQLGDALPIPPAAMGRWITLGSGPDQDLIIRDEPRGIRRSHCRLIFRAGATHIQGRLHPEGYHLNGEHFTDCTARALKHGDLIQIGEHTTFRFAAGGMNDDRSDEDPPYRR
jgi:hypothetical protein